MVIALVFFMTRMITQLTVSVGILLTNENHLHDHIITLRGMFVTLKLD
jgi:hypothetical protein